MAQMASGLFAVPDWDLTKNAVNYDFEKKKFKQKKKNGPKAHVKPEEPHVPATQSPKKDKNVAAQSPKKDKKKNVAAQKPNQPEKKEKSLAIPMKAKDKVSAKASGSSSTSLSDKLKDSLKSSRFRFLNECLYKSKSSEAVAMFKEDPEAFGVYHEGYRQQVTNWPSNPLDRIIKAIRKMPKDQIIADFGCGDAKLAESVPNKVYSLDLVSTKADVIACDMAKTPLKTGTVNVVVFCLSLMGVNLRDFLTEANRVLKPNGILKVAEVKSRFDKVDEFVQHVQGGGFKLMDKDVNGEFFYFFNFKKTGDAPKVGTQFSLKPCLYKKR